MKNKFFKITVPTMTSDYKMFVDIVNQGIDAHLEAFTKSKFEYINEKFSVQLHLNIEHSELPILLRRLREYGTEGAKQWADDIVMVQNEDR